jgi:HNH endonuclease
MKGICQTPGCGKPKLPGTGRRYCADCKAASIARRAEYEAQRAEGRREYKRERERRWRQENPEESRRRNRRSYRKHAEKRRAGARQYWHDAPPEIKEQRRENRRRWERENPEKVRESHRRWARKNRDKTRAASRRYYYAHRDLQRERARQWRQQNQELYREIKRRWDQANAPKIREYARHRRAMKLAATIIEITPEQWAAWCDYWGDRCWLQIPGFCRGVADTVDHVIPLSKGGPHCLANMRPACAPCNSSKSDGDWRRFFPRRKAA